MFSHRNRFTRKTIWFQVFFKWKFQKKIRITKAIKKRKIDKITLHMDLVLWKKKFQRSHLTNTSNPKHRRSDRTVQNGKNRNDPFFSKTRRRHFFF